jgi:hypothetical protein
VAKLEECEGCIGTTDQHTCEGWDAFQEMKAARAREGSKGMPAAEFEIDRLQKRVATLSAEGRSAFDAGYYAGMNAAIKPAFKRDNLVVEYARWKRDSGSPTSEQGDMIGVPSFMRTSDDSSPCPTCADTGCPFPEHREMCGVHHCPDCEPETADSRQEPNSEALAAFMAAVLGWRENDHPIQFCRWTAEYVADLGREALATADQRQAFTIGVDLAKPGSDTTGYVCSYCKTVLFSAEEANQHICTGQNERRTDNGTN